MRVKSSDPYLATYWGFSGQVVFGGWFMFMGAGGPQVHYLTGAYQLRFDVSKRWVGPHKITFAV